MFLIKHGYKILIFSLLIVIVGLKFLNIPDNILRIAQIISILIFEISIFLLVIYKNCKEQNRIVSILNDECNTTLFIEQVHDTIADMKGQGKLLWQINLSAGYISSGQYEEALKILNEVKKELSKYKRVNKYIKLLFEVNFGALNIELGKYKEALNNIENFTKISTQNNHINSKIFTQFNESNELNRCAVKIRLRKANQAVVDYMKGIFEKNSNYNKNYIAFELSKYYIDRGNIKEAKKSLQYVIDNGNELYIKKLAIMIIKEL